MASRFPDRHAGCSANWRWRGLVAGGMRTAAAFDGQDRGARRGQKNDRALHPVQGSVHLFPEGLPAPCFDSGYMSRLAATVRQTEPDTRDVVSLICCGGEKNSLLPLCRERREETEILQTKCPTRQSARGDDAPECGAVRGACQAGRGRVRADRSRFESCMFSWSVALVRVLQSNERTIPGSGVMRRAQCHSATHLAKSIRHRRRALRCTDCRLAGGQACGGRRPVRARRPEELRRCACAGSRIPVMDGLAA